MEQWQTSAVGRFGKKRPKGAWAGLLFVVIVALLVAFMRLTFQSLAERQVDVSYGIVEVSRPELSDEEIEWREREFLPTLAVWARTSGGPQRLSHLMQEISETRDGACGIPCVLLAMELHRAARAQVSQVLFAEEGQRQTAKAQLETLFQLEAAAAISESARQETRARLRDMFLPPNQAMVRAAVFELGHRARQPSGLRSVTKRTVWDALEHFYKDCEAIARQAGERYTDGSVSAESARWIFDEMTTELDQLEATLDATPEKPSILSLTGVLVDRMEAIGEQKPAVGQHLAAIIFARVSPHGVLAEQATYSKLESDLALLQD